MDFITPPIGPNVGGCQPFEFCPAHLVLSIPAAIDSVIEDEILFKGDHRWYEGWHRETTASYNERARESAAGTVYDVSYKFFYPGLSAPVINLMQRLIQMRHILQVKDNNGMLRVAGELENGLRFRYEFGTGEGPTGLRGHQCEFYGTYKTRAPEYTWIPPIEGIGEMAIGTTFEIE